MTLEPIFVTALGFGALLMGLVLMTVTMRTWLTVSGQRAANSFAPDGADVGALCARVCRAHANCVENIGAFALVLLVAIGTGETALLNPLAYAFLAARLFQAGAHVASTSPVAVSIRAVFFLVQVVIMGWWIVALLGGG